ncbi:MAG: serine hydroxymethyltransferase [Candidatus Vogelbacteria bacterium]|nr:serine hydroxymethyltransferase [Candidatus Vogelbacteria bacterium]
MKDKQIGELIQAEEERQVGMINLIASENYVSDDVLEALGSKLTNKYAEGYPGARYYGGNNVIDQVERECQKRALELFIRQPADRVNWAVNVQPLSGSPANVAVYLALVPSNGKIMGMTLAHGGHLTHGHKVSITGKMWQQVPFGVDPKTELINYEEIKQLALKEKPNIIVAGFTAYPRVIEWQKFRDIADACGAYLMVDISHVAGLVAGGAYPSPFPYADVVTTTTHKTLRGPRSALIFSRKINARPTNLKTTVNEVNGFSAGQPRLISELIDKAVFPGMQGGPHLNQIAAVAVALGEAATPEFADYTRQVVQNAQALAGELSRLGWRLVSGGTDSHLLLVDTWLNGKGLSGGEASDRLEKAGIIVNKNAIPGDTRPPIDPSGIRLGTAAETTRGKKERDMVEIAGRINKILRE